MHVIRNSDTHYESNKEQKHRRHCHHNRGLSVHNDQFSHHSLHSVLGAADRVMEAHRVEAAPVEVDHPHPAAGGREDVGGRVVIPGLVS